MISFKQRGSFKKTEKFLRKVGEGDLYGGVKAIAALGVEALADATPKDTGKTSASWSYKIKKEKDGLHIYWSNSNVNDGVNIAMIIQLGHGTGNGIYIEGVDYINPALRPIFDAIAKNVWKEVTENA